MVVGWFSFTGRPFVRVRVIIPRLGIRRTVEFLVDTGADHTCVNHRDVVNMGLCSLGSCGKANGPPRQASADLRGISGKTLGSNFSTRTKSAPANTRSAC